MAEPVIVMATRAMFRAGRHWKAGANELGADEAQTLGPKKLELIAADPNFTIAAVGAKSVVIAANSSGKAVFAHTLVTAQRPMWRAGRSWPAGATALSAKEVRELGPEAIATLEADPNFVLVQNEAGAAEQATAKEEAAAKKAAAEAEAAEKAKAAAKQEKAEHAS